MRRLAVVALAATTAAARAVDVTGTVTDGAGPVSGARVTVFVPNLSVFFETRTSATGAFTVPGVPAGVYRVGVAARGRGYQEVQIQVAAGGPVVRDFVLGAETEPGSWDVIGTTLPEFFDATDIAVLLRDGRIFYCHDTADPIVFNPATGAKFFAADSGLPQGCMNGSLLPDGRVIFAGGQDGDDPGNFMNAIPWVKAYNPTTDTWTRLADLQNAAGRWYPGLARLRDGSIMVMGGGTAPAAVRTNTCERLDLSALTWSFTGSMLRPSEFTPSALLYNGLVLITWSPPQVYNPATGVWRATGDFVQAARGWPGHSDHSIVVLEDGRVLAIGISGTPTASTRMGEVYDPATESWSTTSNPGLIRFQAEVVQLPDGRVLVAGGETKQSSPPVPNSLGIVKWTDLYDPASDSWRRVSDLNRFAEYHAVTLLIPDGRVVTTGGTRIKFQVGPTSADIEAFSPPYLRRGVRPSITNQPGPSLRRGQVVELEIAPATRLTSVVLTGTMSHTHWVDGGVPRRLVLPVTREGSTSRVTLPAGADVLPLGTYMLFAMVDDIPSVAKIVWVEGACYADCNADGSVNLADFGCFQTGFALGDPYADCNGDGARNLADFGCFQTRFALGCP
ncbi:MAG: DUF1929 domain-containing protein [Phycisphaerales bacterium]|nr:DUF1929 domain-containing protein [Phycisphaerales bacterium]